MKRLLLFVASLWLGIVGASAQVDRCDVNGDGEVDISDVTYVVDHILGRGHANTTIEVAGEAIDLGLPSGTKWASFNVGATKPEEYGEYYAWGEIDTKSVYNESTYNYYKDGECVNIGSDISGTEYDVAHVKWGGNWCMPTMNDFYELLDKCTYEYTTLNGVNGNKYTSKVNGNSIFLPAAGFRWGSVGSYTGAYIYYWSSMQSRDYSALANVLFTGSASTYGQSGRCYGLSVRPVFKP